MPSFGKIIKENKKDFSFDSPFDSEKNYVIMSSIGFPQTAKSTFVNCLISHIADTDAKVFNTGNVGTIGIDYVLFKIKNNKRLLIFDCEGITNDSWYILPFAYCMSNIIILNIKNYDEIEMIFNKIKLLDNIVNTTYVKPKLLIRIMDYSSDISVVDTLENYYRKTNKKYDELFAEAHEYFSSIDIFSTERLGRIGRNHIRSEKYFSIVRSDDIGFNIECEKILSDVDCMIPKNFSNLKNTFDEITELLNNKKLQIYNDDFDKTFGPILKIISNLLNKDDEKLLLAEHKYRTITEDYDKILNNLESEIIDITSDDYYKKFEESDISKIMDKIYVCKDNINKRKIEIEELSDKYVLNSRNAFDHLIFNQFAKVKIHGTQIYNFTNQSNEKILNNIYINLLHRFDVLESSIIKLIEGLKQTIKIISDDIIEKHREQTELSNLISKNIDEQFENDNTSAYIVDKLHRIKIPNKKFCLIYSNIMTDLQNELIKKIEDDLPSYELPICKFKNNDTYDLNMSYVLCYENFSNKKSHQPTDFEIFEQKIKSYVSTLMTNESILKYEKIYNDHIINTYKSDINENLIYTNPNIMFAKMEFVMDYPYEICNKNNFAKILRKLKLDNFADQIENTSFIIHFSDNIEEMFKKLCEFAGLSYNFVVENIYVDKVPIRGFSNNIDNLICFKINTIANKLHQQFFNLLIDKYIDLYKFKTNSQEYDNVLKNMIVNQKNNKNTNDKKISFFDYV